MYAHVCISLIDTNKLHPSRIMVNRALCNDLNTHYHLLIYYTAYTKGTYMYVYELYFYVAFHSFCVLFSDLIAAIRLQLPNTSHKGCFFLYTQALGLQQAHRVDATVSRYDITCCL